jgi:hypothetical protein
MPCDYSKYPKEWATTIRPFILNRAGNRCEGSPKFPKCRAENRQPHPETGSIVVLTIAHLDHDTRNNKADNLRAWCQRCHNNYDAEYRRRNRLPNSLLDGAPELKK